MIKKVKPYDKQINILYSLQIIISVSSQCCLWYGKQSIDLYCQATGFYRIGNSARQRFNYLLTLIYCIFHHSVFLIIFINFRDPWKTSLMHDRVYFLFYGEKKYSLSLFSNHLEASIKVQSSHFLGWKMDISFEMTVCATDTMIAINISWRYCSIYSDYVSA